jgi:hypothetical protein
METAKLMADMGREVIGPGLYIGAAVTLIAFGVLGVRKALRALPEDTAAILKALPTPSSI